MPKKRLHGPAWKPKAQRRVLLQVRIAADADLLMRRNFKRYGNKGRALDALIRSAWGKGE